MGLFSFLNKNRQDSATQDSGYYSRDDDDAIAARAKSKRASSAGEPAARRGRDAKGAADPVLPEKKRARRRLVGAIALALAVAVGLPMVLDSEPKPLATDIAIQIPSKERAAPLPIPAPATTPEPAAAGVVPAAAEDTIDAGEQIVAPAKAAPAATTRDVAEVKAGPAKAEPKAAEPRPPVKTVAEAKPDAKPASKPEAKPDAARALAILEGKSAPAKADKYIVQVAALSSQDKVAELQGRLKEAGIASHTQKVPTQSGTLIRVLVGPSSRDDAEKVRAKLGKLGLSGRMVPA